MKASLQRLQICKILLSIGGLGLGLGFRVYKCGTDAKGSLARVEDIFVCNATCERADDGET